MLGGSHLQARDCSAVLQIAAVTTSVAIGKEGLRFVGDLRTLRL
jgi:hypothetical protein